MILLADNILLLTLFEADLRRYFASQYSWLTVCDLFACLKSIQSPPPQEISFVHVFLCRPSPTAPTAYARTFLYAPGGAVGVAALRGYSTYVDKENGYILTFYNSIIAKIVSGK